MRLQNEVEYNEFAHAIQVDTWSTGSRFQLESRTVPSETDSNDNDPAKC